MVPSNVRVAEKSAGILEIIRSYSPRKNKFRGNKMEDKRRKPRRLRAKTKFIDGRTFIHPNVSYKLSDRRRRWINRVNDFVRRGMTFKEISKVMDMSETTVAVYYYGMATNSLSPKQLEELKQLPNSMKYWTRTHTRIAADGETPTRRNVLSPIYTNISIREIPFKKLTDSQPMPLEVITTKYIPSNVSKDFGKHEQESYEYVDIIETRINCCTLKNYCVMYRGACADI
jgi:hypothetical protein